MPVHSKSFSSFFSYDHTYKKMFENMLLTKRNKNVEEFVIKFKKCFLYLQPKSVLLFSKRRFGDSVDVFLIQLINFYENI